MAIFIYYLTIVVISLVMNAMLGLSFRDIEWWIITIGLIVCRICGQEEKKND